MDFKEDIIRKIQSDFKESTEEAFLLIEAAIKQTDELNTDRVIRCIIFLANGKITELKRWIDLAHKDPRDVMVAAEYEDGGTAFDLKRIRNFNHTFEDNQ